MQIDFHYDTIYVLARYAGFNREDAEIIAHSSQYVDDAENGGLIKFSNYPSYYHIRTSHEKLDIDNLNMIANFNTWVPFHFIPGNKIDEPKEGQASLVSNLICRENSQIAKEMMEECIQNKNGYNDLHRLGISLHVYADTWAHQNFAGINDKVNYTRDISVCNNKGKNILSEIETIITNDVTYIENNVIDDTLLLGHGSVKSYPDIPYIRWSYTNYLGENLKINNSDRFISAAKEIYKYLKLYQIGDSKAETGQLPKGAEDKIKYLFENVQGDKEERHKIWQLKLQEDYFGFNDNIDCPYNAYGPNSWKSIALNEDVSRNDNNDVYKADEKFINSNWKKFHDAAAEHSDFVINTLLPKYKIISTRFKK